MSEFVRDHYDALLAIGLKQLQDFKGTQRVTLSDAITLFMSLHTQEDALPVLTVAYSLASRPSPNPGIAQIIKNGMTKRFNDLP